MNEGFSYNLRDGDGQILGIAIFLAIFIGVFIYLWRLSKGARYWAKGIFPPFYPPNEKSKVEAYSALGALLISIDSNTTGEKVEYMVFYFSRNFRLIDKDFRENIIYALRSRVTPKSVTNWLNRNVKSQHEKKKVIQFLANVGMVDGDLTKHERAFLKMVNDYLKLSPSTVNSILEDVERIERNNREYAKKKAAPRPRVNMAYSILGVSKGATVAEIKKAYRKLVKLHHPDNFANESAAKQQNAEDKFIEIQKAYESLTD